MKAYIQPETTEMLLLSEFVMKVAGDASLPQHVGAGGESDSGSLMMDAPGNKRRQL